MEEQGISIEQEAEINPDINSEELSFPQPDEFLSDSSSMNGNELINATQNAIVGAAENVSEALTLTEKKDVPHENIPLYLDVEFWVGLSFVLVVMMIAKPLWRAIKNGLQNNIKAVVDQIDEAIKLRDDAQKLLAEYEKRCNDIDERVAQISEQTQKNISLHREHKLKSLKKELDKKQKEALAFIERSAQTAKDEINASISKKTADLVQKVIEKNIKDVDKVRLIDEAIVGLDQLKK